MFDFVGFHHSLKMTRPSAKQILSSPEPRAAHVPMITVTLIIIVMMIIHNSVDLIIVLIIIDNNNKNKKKSRRIQVHM